MGESHCIASFQIESYRVELPYPRRESGEHCRILQQECSQPTPRIQGKHAERDRRMMFGVRWVTRERLRPVLWLLPLLSLVLATLACGFSVGSHYGYQPPPATHLPASQLRLDVHITGQYEHIRRDASHPGACANRLRRRIPERCRWPTRPSSRVTALTSEDYFGCFGYTPAAASLQEGRIALSILTNTARRQL